MKQAMTGWGPSVTNCYTNGGSCQQTRQAHNNDRGKADDPILHPTHKATNIIVYQKGKHIGIYSKAGNS